ncbi:hypothetical protein BT93_F0028 [Corymbia citriodora subsp. variegata]|nr:hypothetical protein BT93_F0028 [Corymbia citriodora subsp. variegata]
MPFEGNLDQEWATSPKKSPFRYKSPPGRGGSSTVPSSAWGWQPGGALVGMGVAASAYALYAGSFLDHNHYHHQTFAIVTGVILGIGAGEGAILTSYPPHNRKGTYISLFWSIYCMGGVIGGLVPFILNYNRNEAGSVNDATYVGFMCFMIVGALLSLTILPPSKVEYLSVSTEATKILKLFLNWKMLLIALAAWAGNFFYSYQLTNVNGALFNLRARGLNSVFYWVTQIPGSIAIGYVLDFSLLSRKMRGYVGIAIVALLGTAVSGGGLANQLKYSCHNLPEKLDFKDFGSNYAGPFMLYLSCGLLDASRPCLLVIGCLADDPETLSRYSGFYKGVQSAGAAVGWQIDMRNVPFLSELVVNQSLMTVCYPSLLVLVKLAVKDDEDGEEGAEKEIASAFAR